MIPVFSIFRAGTHTDMLGREFAYGADDLDITAAVYDPAVAPAPLCLGHPDNNRPSYGVVTRLFQRGGALFAFADVGDELVGLVRAGRYRKRSASFYKPDSPLNPACGAWYLRHVGFLGAAAPAVHGLADPEFGAPREGAVAFVEAADVAFADGDVALHERLRCSAESWRLHRLALETQAACSALSYAEAAMLAEKAVTVTFHAARSE